MKPDMLTANFQSNSIRGEMLRTVTDKTVDEVLADISPFFGPGATDGYIIKNDGVTYYTRDGKEVLESLRFDNELATYVHHVLYQAVYNQGRNVGDGSTTLAILYCYLYKQFRRCLSDPNNPLSMMSMNEAREKWMELVSGYVSKLEQSKTILEKEYLRSLLYTCTQDAELAGKLYDQLGGAIMESAYIIPRKSNIESDFKVTAYTRPTFRVTELWKAFPVSHIINNAVVLFCNGIIDIAYENLIINMMSRVMCQKQEDGSDKEILTNFIFIGHGVNETTRQMLKRLSARLNDSLKDKVNNVIFYSLDDYRSMDREELEDLATIITGDKGVSAMTQHVTFASYLYQAFYMADKESGMGPIEELDALDCDPHTVDQLRSLSEDQCSVMVDLEHGMAIDKPLNEAAQLRYDDLRRQIEEEKSSVRRMGLIKRLRRSFGKFIDVEIGSTLMKDSQRKYELVLDAVLSSADAINDGVLIGNSLVHLMRSLTNASPADMKNPFYSPLLSAVVETIFTLIKNKKPQLAADTETSQKCRRVIMMKCKSNPPENFTLNADGDSFWSSQPYETVRFGDELHQISIVESFGVIRAILENSSLPLELAMMKVFHISGDRGFMGNYVG